MTKHSGAIHPLLPHWRVYQLLRLCKWRGETNGVGGEHRLNILAQSRRKLNHAAITIFLYLSFYYGKQNEEPGSRTNSSNDREHN